jgi:hypothetical protein
MACAPEALSPSAVAATAAAHVKSNVRSRRRVVGFAPHDPLLHATPPSRGQAADKKQGHKPVHEDAVSPQSLRHVRFIASPPAADALLYSPPEEIYHVPLTPAEVIDVPLTPAQKKKQKLVRKKQAKLAAQEYKELEEHVFLMLLASFKSKDSGRP